MLNAPSFLPIMVLTQGDFIHYPASVDDIANIIKLLPASITFGLQSIEFCLGNRTMKSIDEDLVKDPYLGSRGYQIAPGLYNGELLGEYYVKTHLIRMYAYVYADSIPNRDIWEIYLKIEMLLTFIHELYHHFDHMSRRFGDRWTVLGKGKEEYYAETKEIEWTELVIKYVKERYPLEYSTFHNYLKEHTTQSDENRSVLELLISSMK